MAFTNDDWAKVQARIAAEVKALEETLIAKQTKELAQGLTLTKDQWALNRLARQQTVAAMFRKEIQRAVKPIRARALEGLQDAIEISAKDVVKAVNLDALQAVKRVKGVSLSIGAKAVNDRIETAMQALFQQAVQDYRATINAVKLDSRGLFEALSSAVESKSDNGYITYSNGNKVSFKTYMEMSIRTDLQQNALYNLEESAKAAGLEAFVASAHFDSADDHADFQGYYYLADGVPWKPEYERLGFHPKYHYLSEVKALGFLTRPNCRHYVQPVLLEDIVAKKDLHKILGVKNQTVKDGAYEDLKTQRYNERMIRKYKERAVNDEIMLESIPKSETVMASEAEAKLKYDKAKAREWQARQRQLERQSAIKRDYRREKPGVVVQNAKPVKAPAE